MNENNLVVKNVEFNGATLRAAQDTDGQIYAGVKWMCDGIGLSDDKMKYERKKIQKDAVLNSGVKFYPLGNNTNGKGVLCLQLDYVPLWLAKISITPSMKQENPQLVKNLVSYQLKAKDVLADAFLNKEQNTSYSTPHNTNGNILQVQLPDQQDYSQDFQKITDELKSIHEENLYLKKGLNTIYKNMGTLSSFLIDWKDSSKNDNNVCITNASAANAAVEYADSKVRKQRIVYYPYSDEELSSWKGIQYAMMNKIIKERKTILTNKNAILKYVYDYMRRHYGICWEQEVKDYKKKYYLNKKPYTIDVVYDNEQYRSIFTSILAEMYHQNINHEKVNNNSLKKQNEKDVPNSNNTNSNNKKSNNANSNNGETTDTYVKRIVNLNNSINLLAKRYNDTSVYKMCSWQLMYKELTNMYNVNWDNLTTRYIHSFGKRPKTKKEIISQNPALYQKTMKCIDLLMSKQDVSMEVA